MFFNFSFILFFPFVLFCFLSLLFIIYQLISNIFLLYFAFLFFSSFPHFLIPKIILTQLFLPFFPLFLPSCHSFIPSFSLLFLSPPTLAILHLSPQQEWTMELPGWTGEQLWVPQDPHTHNKALEPWCNLTPLEVSKVVELRRKWGERLGRGWEKCGCVFREGAWRVG